MYCSNCGTKIKDDVNFCTACGTPIASNTNITNNVVKSKKPIIILTIIGAAVLVSAYPLYNWVLNPYLQHRAAEKLLEVQYQAAEKLLEEKNYQAALDKFVELGDYSDSKECVSKFIFVPETITAPYGDISRYSYIINDNGQLSSANEINRYSGNIDYTFAYENGSLKRYTETCTSDDDNNNNEYHSGEYNYDYNGRLISTAFIHNSSYNNITSQYSYEYDEQNNIRGI